MRKIIVSILLAATFLVQSLLPTSVKRVSAASTWYNQTYTEWRDKVYDSSNPSEVFGERYTAAQVQWIIYSIFAFVESQTHDPQLSECLKTPPNVVECTKFLGQALKLSSAEDNSSSQLAFENKNPLAFIFLEDRPMSGISYFRQVTRKFNPVPEVKAQTGFGFSNALSPALPMWRAVRNVSYALMVLVIISMSFMIMFRVKISPQAVITIQSALPKIVSALILITFSYAIAGLLVDLMYVVIGLISFIVAQIYKDIGWIHFFGGDVGTSALFTYMTQGPGAGGVYTGIFGSMLIYILFFSIALLLGIFASGGLVGAGIVTAGSIAIIRHLNSIGLGNLIGQILFFVVIVGLIILFFRTLWALVKAFAYVILLTAFAPIFILLGILNVPGTGFGSWMKMYISNLAVFPTVGALLALAFLFVGLGFSTIVSGIFPTGGPDIMRLIFGNLIFGTTSPGWPPLLGYGTGVGLGLVYLGLSLVLFLIIPSTTALIQGIITGRPMAFGTAINESTRLPLTTGQGLLGRGASRAEAAAMPSPPPGWVSFLRSIGAIRR